LACFFKSPMGVAEHDFHKQFEMLRDYVEIAHGAALHGWNGFHGSEI